MPTKIPDELMDEMVVRVQERIAFRQRYGKHISLLSLSLQLFDEACAEGVLAETQRADVLADAVRALLKEWRQP